MNPVKRAFAAWVLCAACLVALPVTPAAAAGSSGSSATVAADFNGDGIDDLAVGASGEDTGDEGSEVADAGAVHVLYGSTSGLNALGNQLFTQQGLGAGSDPGSGFGRKLAAGRFNGDGYHDLAIGVPTANLGAITNTGSVYVLYGGPGGLDASTAEVLSQSDSTIEGFADETEYFGIALAAGNLGNGPQDDLVVGVLEGSTLNGGGAINVIYGSEDGLTSVGDQLWDQNSEDIQGVVEKGDSFGTALAVGNFGGSNHGDVAIGIPGQDVITVEGDHKKNPGAVAVIYGSTTGLTAQGNKVFQQDTPGVPDKSQFEDRFGYALAAGNFGRGTTDDLAVGANGEDNDTGSEMYKSGAVTVLYGKSNGLSSDHSQFWWIGKEGMPALDQSSWSYGNVLTAGDLGKSGHADLVASFHRTSPATAGAVNVIYGSADGLRSTGSQIWHQNKPGIAGDSADNDWIGSLAAGDFGKSTQDDLAMGFGQDQVSDLHAGAVNVIYAKAAGLASDGDQYWHQDSPGVLDQAETGDRFGGL
jgi:FG-GAP repeat